MRRCGGQFARSSGLIGLLLVTLGGGAEASPFVEICAPRDKRPPVYFLASSDGSTRRMDVAITKEGGYRATYPEVPRDLIVDMCSKGIGISTMPMPGEPMKGGADSAKIPTYAAITSSFSISAYTFWGVSYTTGSFWVPGDMPSTDNAHLSTFDVSATNFENATGGAHFVHMLLASSNSNIDADYNGKGMIFGPYGFWCSPPPASAGGFGAISETFMYPPVGHTVSPGGPTPDPAWYANPNRSKIWAGADMSRDSFGAGDAPFHTCTATSASTQMSFLVGANRWQQSVYYSRPTGVPTWSTTPVVDSTAPYFLTGKAGTAYFVAGSGVIGDWRLDFENVSAWTQP